VVQVNKGRALPALAGIARTTAAFYCCALSDPPSLHSVSGYVTSGHSQRHLARVRIVPGLECHFAPIKRARSSDHPANVGAESPEHNDSVQQGKYPPAEPGARYWAVA